MLWLVSCFTLDWSATPKEKDCLCLNVDCPGVIVGDEMTFVCQKHRDWFLWSFPPLEIIQKLHNLIESLELKVVPKHKEMWFSKPKDEFSKHSWRHNPKEVLFMNPTTNTHQWMRPFLTLEQDFFGIVTLAVL